MNTTVYCVGDNSRRSIQLDMKSWNIFLDQMLRKNKNFKPAIFEPYRKPSPRMDLYFTLYEELYKFCSDGFIY